MNLKLLVTALFFFAAASLAWADRGLESVQQKLKDQGFYYGEINGKKDTDTVAAIRRYQIRNGLKVTGEIDATTQRSLGLTSAPASTPRPRTTATPGPPPPDYSPAPKNSPAPRPPQDDYQDESADAPRFREPRPEMSGLFDGTPLETAPLEVQRNTIAGAQLVLMRQGFYRSGIDGVFGPGTEFAIRGFQARFGLTPNGRLDTETLASLGLLPRQHRAGFGPPRRRTFFPPRVRIGPTGEPIYIPN